MAILPDDIKSPVMTASMELELDDIAKGQKRPAEMYKEVVREIRKDIDVVRAMPERARKPHALKNAKPFMSDACPMCGGDLVETPKTITCLDCGFVVWRTIAKKRVPLPQIKSLVKTGMSTEKLSGFKSKKGNEFSCWLYLDDKGKVTFDFDDEGRTAKTNFVKRGSNKK
jgi:DNA topoisomerase-3